MIPVAVLRELLAVTLGTLTLRLRANVSFPSTLLSKDTGMVTELVVLPARKVADRNSELKSTPATQNYCIKCLNTNIIYYNIPSAETGDDSLGVTSTLID